MAFYFRFHFMEKKLIKYLLTYNRLNTIKFEVISRKISVFQSHTPNSNSIFYAKMLGQNPSSREDYFETNAQTVRTFPLMSPNNIRRYGS